MAPAILRRVATLLLLALLAGGCGFHLRGAQPLRFHRLYLEASSALPFSNALRTTLANNPALELLSAPKGAEVRLQILDERRERAILSLTTAGRVRELTLRQRVRFQALDAAGDTLLPPTDLVVERVLSFNDPDTLAKENEETQIYQELQTDTVRLLMLRLAALKPGLDGHTGP
jgi:LPS-assembly lipoprotein